MIGLLLTSGPIRAIAGPRLSFSVPAWSDASREWLLRRLAALREASAPSARGARNARTVVCGALIGSTCGRERSGDPRPRRSRCGDVHIAQWQGDGVSGIHRQRRSECRVRGWRDGLVSHRGYRLCEGVCHVARRTCSLERSDRAFRVQGPGSDVLVMQQEGVPEANRASRPGRWRYCRPVRMEDERMLSTIQQPPSTSAANRLQFRSRDQLMMAKKPVNTTQTESTGDVR